MIWAGCECMLDAVRRSGALFFILYVWRFAVTRVSGHVLTRPDMETLSGPVFTRPDMETLSGPVFANPELTMTTSHDPTIQSGAAEPTAPVERESESPKVGVHFDTRLPQLPWSRRIQIPLIAALVYSVIRILGPTLRFEVLGWQHAENVYASG